MHQSQIPLAAKDKNHHDQDKAVSHLGTPRRKAWILVQVGAGNQQTTHETELSQNPRPRKGN